MSANFSDFRLRRPKMDGKKMKGKNGAGQELSRVKIKSILAFLARISASGGPKWTGKNNKKSSNKYIFN